MLGKLLKYEFKSTARIFLPLYAILLISAFVSGLLNSKHPWGLASNISQTIFFGLCVAVFVMTILILIQRFSKNLLQDEGYLMMTLPVKTHTLLFSKLIPAMVWSIASMFTGMLAFYLLFSADLLFTLNFWHDIFTVFFPAFWKLLSSIPGSVYWALFQSFLWGMLTLSAFILMVYLSLSTGQLPMVAKHRKLASFGTFLILYILNQVIVIKSIEIIDKIHAPNGYFFYQVIDTINGTMPIILCVVLAINMALFAGTNFILQKHLNLE